MAVLIFVSQRIKTANCIIYNCMPLNLFNSNKSHCAYPLINELTLRSLHDAPKINKRYNNHSQNNDKPYTETNEKFLNARKNRGFRKNVSLSNHLRHNSSREYINNNRKTSPYKYSKPLESSKLSHITPKIISSSHGSEGIENEASALNRNNENVEPFDDISDNLIYTEDPDSFGMLSRTNEQFTKNYELDEDDKREEEFLQNVPLFKQKLSTKKYADMIKHHIEHKRIKEALDVLETRMLKQDRVKPENYIYNLLIGGCARVGYTKKAFMLFNDLKMRGLKVTGGTYTSLFNACANSPWPADGLQRASNLRLLMAEKGEEPNLTSYNSMIKAFGRCGDVQTAFSIVDEMISKKIKIRVHTFNFLLQACISDKNRGFQHALVVWKKMLSKKEKPNIYSFNLILKCVKECNFGGTPTDLDVLKSLCFPIDKGSIRQLPDSSVLMTELKQLNASSVSEPSRNDKQAASDVISPAESSSSIHQLNLLSQVPDTRNLVSIEKIITVEDRMSAIGGYLGFLREMNVWGVEPDIKSLTQLLSVTPNTIEVENKILEIKKILNINADIDFYNALIKRRCYRFDYDSAKEVKKLIKDENGYQVKQTYWKSKTMLSPNIMTYGLMALYCVTKEDAEVLLNEMTSARLGLNSEILGTLLRNGTANINIEYVLFVMNFTKTERIEVNDVYFSHIKNFYNKCKMILRGELKLNGNPATPEFEKAFKKFQKEYKKFMKTEKPAEEHPWSQFRANQPETIQRPTVIPKPVRYYKRVSRRIPKYVVKV